MIDREKFNNFDKEFNNINNMNNGMDLWIFNNNNKCKTGGPNWNNLINKLKKKKKP